jgi:glycosyltransferase involved in cell wall biosynthesis
MTTAASIPTISIVTPSFNRVRYLAATMDSVLSQDYSKLEYVVVDGGSTDGSAELISHRSEELTWSVSEADNGAWEAVNKGFAHTAGEIMGWLGSDDLLMPWTLSVIGELFAAFPQVEWLTTLYPTVCDERGRAVRCSQLAAFSKEAFFRGANLPGAGWSGAGFIQQEATFWRRSLWERAGGRLDDSLRLAADFELWARFHRAGAALYAVGTPLAAFRLHGDQKSQSEFAAYIEEARGVFLRYGGTPPMAAVRERLLSAIGRSLPSPLRSLLGPAVVRLAGLADPTQRLCLLYEGLEEGWRIEGA